MEHAANLRRLRLGLLDEGRRRAPLIPDVPGASVETPGDGGRGLHATARAIAQSPPFRSTASGCCTSRTGASPHPAVNRQVDFRGAPVLSMGNTSQCETHRPKNRKGSAEPLLRQLLYADLLIMCNVRRSGACEARRFPGTETAGCEGAVALGGRISRLLAAVQRRCSGPDLPSVISPALHL